MTLVEKEEQSEKLNTADLKYYIKTFGCQMNTSDSERLSTIIEALGYTHSENEEAGADLIIYNTCSVKQKAEDKVHGAIKLAAKNRKERPHLLIGVTGCMVRQSGVKSDVSIVKEEGIEGLPEERAHRALDLKKRGLKSKKGVDELLKKMEQVDFVFRIEDLAMLGDLLKDADPNLELNELIDEGTLENYFKISPKHESKVQAFVPVMTGCDKFCTYCIVPFTRGREYSRDFDEIVNECKELVRTGTKEITLVGQTVNTYGLSRMDRASKKFDWYYRNGGQLSSAYRGNRPDDSGVEKPFVRLLKEIDKLSDHGLKRLRYTSPHPRDFTPDVVDAIASLKTVCPHIHMPVQSGSDTVLKRMNRNYSKAEYVEILKNMRDKVEDLHITTDIIVGFCGETDEEFEETYKMYDELEWDFCFLSQYSPRKGTVSERMMDDDVPREVKKARWSKMNELMKQKVYAKNRSMIGNTYEVLVEKSEKTSDGFDCSGRTEGFKEVKFKSGRDLKGQFVDIKITEALEWVLIGELV